MNTNKIIKAGIVGGAGYTAGELIRLLLLHPNTEIVFVHSKSQAGNFLHEVHTDLVGDTELKFTDEIRFDCDVLFLCVSHGESKIFIDQNKIPSGLRIIDLSQDFRWAGDKNFIYGLPELQKEKVKQAKFISNPGCFATAIQLALLPLAKKNELNSAIHVNATTGSTGAGQSPSPTTHYSWRNNNLSVYRAFDHQHLYEIKKSLSQLQKNFHHTIHFIPQRGSFTRGIQATVYTASDLTLEEAKTAYSTYYKDHPFVYVSDKPIDLKQVVNTNKCLLHIEKHNELIFITSVIDNLLKGASGQAVQNMNILFGLEETTGLKLKPIAF
jgi:N-acetyl-gamma-glutamyl-phosphate reductase